MPFAKGQSGNPNGRPRRVTPAVQRLARKLFDKPYWIAIKKQLDDGTLNAKIHVTLLAYAFGPADKTDHAPAGVTVNVGFLNASDTPHRRLHQATVPTVPDIPQLASAASVPSRVVPSDS